MRLAVDRIATSTFVRLAAFAITLAAPTRSRGSLRNHRLPGLWIPCFVFRSDRHYDGLPAATGGVALRIARPIISGMRGTTAFPQAPTRSILAGIPSTTLAGMGSFEKECTSPAGARLCANCCRQHSTRRSCEVSGRKAAIQTRSRIWAAPRSAACMQFQIASYPSAAKSPSTRANHAPRPPESSSETFSTTATPGRTSPIIRAKCVQRPERSPSMPSRSPASDKSWHGKPPQIASTAIPSAASRSAVSSRMSW